MVAPPVVTCSIHWYTSESSETATFCRPDSMAPLSRAASVPSSPVPISNVNASVVLSMPAMRLITVGVQATGCAS